MYENHRDNFGRRDDRWRREEERYRRGAQGSAYDDDRTRWSTRDGNTPAYGWREDDDYPRRQPGGDWGNRSHEHGHDHRHGQSYAESYGDNRQQQPFTGQQSSWAVPTPNPYGSTGGYGGYGEDYREHGYTADRRHGDGDRGFFDKAGDEIASWFGDEDAARRREEDHRGRGPKDYTRSDERIREDANDRLTDDPRVDASNVTVAVDQGEVTLSGTVTSRQAKRRAEDCVEMVSGVKNVQNNLRVAETAAGSFDRNWTQNTTSTAEGGTLTTGTGEKV